MIRRTEALRPRRIDMDGGPGRALRIGEALGRAHQPVGTGQLADRDDDPLAARPGTADAERADVVEHLRIDGLRSATQREFAERRYDAEQKRMTVGLSTTFQLFQAQRDLSQARNNELQAIIDYLKSVVDFQTVQETPLGGGGGVATVNTGTFQQQQQQQ